MKNPIDALMSWRKRKFDERMALDQARARRMGGDCADFAARRAQLQLLMDSRTFVIPPTTVETLRGDPLFVNKGTAALLRATLVDLAQDPSVRAVGDTGFRFRGDLRLGAPNTGNVFVDQLQIIASVVIMDTRIVPKTSTHSQYGDDERLPIIPGYGREGAQVAIVHDLLPEHQQADFLDTLTGIVVRLEQTEREVMARHRRTSAP